MTAPPERRTTDHVCTNCGWVGPFEQTHSAACEQLGIPPMCPECECDTHPRKRGRPTMAKGKARSVMVTVRLTPAEVAELDERAEAAELSRSALVRRLLTGGEGAP